MSVWLRIICSFAHHNGGVCVSAFTHLLTALPSCSHTSVYHLGHIRHFPGKVNSSYVDGKPVQREQIQPGVSNEQLLPCSRNTYARCHSLGLAYTKHEFSEITIYKT